MAPTVASEKSKMKERYQRRRSMSLSTASLSDLSQDSQEIINKLLSQKQVYCHVSSCSSVVSDLTEPNFLDDDEYLEDEEVIPRGPALPPTLEQTYIVRNTWQRIKSTVLNYRALVGELIALRMMKLDPSVRQQLKLFSLRSSLAFAMFEECSSIAEDLVLSCELLLHETSSFQKTVDRIAQHCDAEGISLTLLSGSITHAVQKLCMEACFHLEYEEHAAWVAVMDFMTSKVQPQRMENNDL